MSAVRYNIFYGIWHLRNRITRINLEATETIQNRNLPTEEELLLFYLSSLPITTTVLLQFLLVLLFLHLYPCARCRLDVTLSHPRVTIKEVQQQKQMATDVVTCCKALLAIISIHSVAVRWFNKSSLRLPIPPPHSSTKKCNESIMQKGCTYKFPFATDNI